MPTIEKITQQIVEMVTEYIEHKSSYPQKAFLGIHKNDLYMFIDRKGEFNDCYLTIQVNSLICTTNGTEFPDVEHCRDFAKILW